MPALVSSYPPSSLPGSPVKPGHDEDNDLTFRATAFSGGIPRPALWQIGRVLTTFVFRLVLRSGRRFVSSLAGRAARSGSGAFVA